MNNFHIFLFMVMAIVIFSHRNCSEKEYLVSRPQANELPRMVRKIMGGKDYFSSGGNLDEVKKSMPWMDAVLYEDLRHMYGKGNFTESNIKKVFE